MVSDSPLMSAPAEAVEAIHGIMPPKGFLGPLLTTEQVEHYNIRALYHDDAHHDDDAQISVKCHAVFLYASKIS